MTQIIAQQCLGALPRLASGRWISIGRLDINTQGLLLLTTDGELAHRLMHPTTGIERQYAVRVLGKVNPVLVQRLREGVMLDDGPARFEQITVGGGEGANHWYHVSLREGRNREVRRLWESQGVTVSRLLRVGYGPIKLRRGLRPGHWDELDDTAMDLLLKAVGLEPSSTPLKPGTKQRPRSGKRSTGRPVSGH